MVELSERVKVPGSVEGIRRRRLAYAIPGIAIGLVAGGLAGSLAGGSNWIVDAVAGSFAGYELAIGLGERFRGLPNLNDLARVRMREEMSPLDLRNDDRVLVTLKTCKEVQAKR